MSLPACPFCKSLDVSLYRVTEAIGFHTYRIHHKVKCTRCYATGPSFHLGTFEENNHAAICAWSNYKAPLDSRRNQDPVDLVARSYGHRPSPHPGLLESPFLGSYPVDGPAGGGEQEV